MSEPISCKAKRRRFQKPIIRIHLSISVTNRGNSADSIILPRTIHVSVFRKRAGTDAKFTMPRVFILSMQNVTLSFNKVSQLIGSIVYDAPKERSINRRDWINRAPISTCLGGFYLAFEPDLTIPRLGMEIPSCLDRDIIVPSSAYLRAPLMGLTCFASWGLWHAPPLWLW